MNEVHIGYMDCIPDNFCVGLGGLGSVTVDNLASPVVGDSAFEYCSSLYEINIPDVTEVGSRAFAGSGISSFDGKNLVSLGGEAFADSDVVSVTFEGNSALTGIPDAAFYGCDSLREIVLPENLETIGTGAFSYCSQIEYINLPSGLKEIGATAFSDCSSLRQVIVPDGTEFIGEGVFWNCTGMSSLTLPYLGYSADEPATLANLFAWSENSLRDVTLTRASVRCARYLCPIRWKASEKMRSRNAHRSPNSTYPIRCGASGAAHLRAVLRSRAWTFRFWAKTKALPEPFPPCSDGKITGNAPGHSVR